MTDVPSSLVLRQITVDYGANRALDNVNFELRTGEIHALLGENGAGKSTLMNVIRGLVKPTTGEVIVRGDVAHIGSPAQATKLGIGMVHQHFLLVPVMSVADNLTLASQSDGVFLKRASVVEKASAIAARLGWTIPFDARVADLPVGVQQRVEILKSLLIDAHTLLFDEPTAVLAPAEIDELFVVLRALKSEGRSIVFVSHKLGEVMALCDRVTVLRRGQLVGTVNVAETNPDDLARRMVGEGARELVALSEPSDASDLAVDAAPYLSIAKLSTYSRRAEEVALVDLSFTVAAGEILAFAGVDGNGQTELFEALTGLRSYRAESLEIAGQNYNRLSPRELSRLGIATIPPDRHRQGLALNLSVADNLTLDAPLLPEFRRGPFLRRRAIRELAGRLAADYDVRAADLRLPTRSLSGGNQQKIVIARALWRRPKLLIAVSPTRGLDVAATAYVHTKIREARDGGAAVLLISTELDEIYALASRIAVLYEGQIAGIVESATSRETVALLMGGKQKLETE